MIFLQTDLSNQALQYWGAYGFVVVLLFLAITWLLMERKAEKKIQEDLRIDIKALQNSKDELTKDCLNALNAYSSAIEKQTIIESNAKESLAKTIEAFRKAVEDNKCKVQ